MLNITNEGKAKLLAAKSEEEVTKLLKADGQEITPEDAPRLWGEIEKQRELEGRELSMDELEAVGGGMEDRDFLEEGCAATVEPHSWCDSNDWCFLFSVVYTHNVIRYCSICGGKSYRIYPNRKMQWSKCINCGYEEY